MPHLRGSRSLGFLQAPLRVQQRHSCDFTQLSAALFRCIYTEGQQEAQESVVYSPDILATGNRLMSIPLSSPNSVC